jgi:outer membrane protein
VTRDVRRLATASSSGSSASAVVLRLLCASVLVLAAFAALARPAPALAAAEGVERHWEAGLARLAAGDAAGAIGHLERVVSALPAHPEARVALGRAYFLADDHGKARFHLSHALSGRLSEGLREDVRRQIAAIDARRVWTGRFTLALAPQSNAVRRTRARTVLIGGVPWRLNDDARREPGVGVQIRAGVTGAPRLGPTLRGQVALGAQGTFHRVSEHDDVALAARLALVRAFGGFALSVGARAEHRWIGGDSFRREAGPTVALERAAGPALRWSLRAEGVTQSHPGRRALDGERYLIAADLHRVVTPATVVRAEISAQRKTAAAPRDASRALGLSLGGTHALPGGLVAGVDLTVERELRDGAQPIFGATRRDWTATAAARVLHRTAQWRGYAPFLEIAHERRWSSLPLFDYDNTRATIGVTRGF